MTAPRYLDKPPAACVWCGKGTWAKSRVCENCKGIEPSLRRGYTDAHALTGGRWIPVGGILRWTGPRPTDDEQIDRRRVKCGTDSGYHHHVKRAKTPPCEPCKAAHRAAERRRAAA